MSNAVIPRNIVLRFDMRRSPQSEDSESARYSAAIDMAQWADNNCVDVVGLSEHHDSPDGFLSSPLLLAGMIAARTLSIRLSVSALLVPLHDPLRLAEDISVLDLVSNGRFSTTCGLGYREQEYQQFGVDWAHRGKIFDDKLDTLVAALSGESFLHNGKETRLAPAPLSPVQALLLIGGNSKAAARRAARLGLLFCPAIDDPELEATYLAACEEYNTGFAMTIFPREPATTFICEDPDAGWKQLGRYLLFDALAYGAWRHPNRRAYAESFACDMEALRQEGKYRILSPEQALQTIEETGSLHLAPLCGGVPVAQGWKSLKLFEDKVQPYLT